jgi:hypothetical protein
MKRQGLVIWSLVVVLLFAAHPLMTAAPTRRLSKAEAVRLADQEARRYSRGDLKQFKHSPILHFPAEQRWYIGYLRPGHKFVDFGIDVFEKSGKASVILAP